MICKFCGGEVTWRGPLINLTHTKCLSCGAINSQYSMNQEDIKTMMKKYREVTGNEIKDISTDLEFATWAAGWQGGMETERDACIDICYERSIIENKNHTIDLIAAEIWARGENA